MGEETADCDVADVLPIAIADIGGEGVEVSSVGLDGVGRGVALAQMTQKVVGRALDYGANLFHDLLPAPKNLPRRHGETKDRFCRNLLSWRIWVIRNEIKNSI